MDENGENIQIRTTCLIATKFLICCYQTEWLNGHPKHTYVLWLTFAVMDMDRNNFEKMNGSLTGWKDIFEVNE